MSADGTIDLEIVDTIARVTINRAEALNAMTLEMYERLGEICEAVAADPSVRIVLFKGAGGKAFSAGTDINVFKNFDGGDDGISYERSMDHYLTLVAQIPQTTVAAIEGIAVGGGLNIAAACDIRIATDDSSFGVPIARTLGGCLSMRNYAGLVAAFGVSRAKQMLVLGESMSAADALCCGFLARVAPRDAFPKLVDDITDRIIANAPITQWASKQAFVRLAQYQFPKGDDLIKAVYGSQDFADAVQAFLDKRKPVWRGQ